MRRFSLAVATALPMFIALGSAQAQGGAPGADRQPTITAMVEADPVPFALDGFSLHARIAHRALPGWVFGAGLYGLRFPGFYQDIFPRNRGEGWNSRIRHAHALFVDYHFAGRPQGLFVGLQVAAQRLEVTNDNVQAAAAESVNLLAMGRVGYLWRPFEAGFYVMPWMGLGGTLSLGDRTVADQAYEVFPLAVFGTAHLGWMFE